MSRQQRIECDSGSKCDNGLKETADTCWRPGEGTRKRVIKGWVVNGIENEANHEFKDLPTGISRVRLRLGGGGRLRVGGGWSCERGGNRASDPGQERFSRRRGGPCPRRRRVAADRFAAPAPESARPAVGRGRRGGEPGARVAGGGGTAWPDYRGPLAVRHAAVHRQLCQLADRRRRGRRVARGSDARTGAGGHGLAGRRGVCQAAAGHDRRLDAPIVRCVRQCRVEGQGVEAATGASAVGRRAAVVAASRQDVQRFGLRQRRGQGVLHL